MADLHCITHDPIAPTTHTHTLIFLHGRGDTATNFSQSLTRSRSSAGLSLPEHLPTFRFVFPTSAIRPLAASGGRERWSQWFDVWDTRDYKSNEELQLTGLRESVAGLRRILAREAELLGGRWERVVLAGISQGAAASIQTLINLDVSAQSLGEGVSAGQQGTGDVPLRRLGAWLGFSCRMPFAGRPLKELRDLMGLDDVPEGDEVLKNTPILLEHCADDRTVPIEHGRQLRDTLEGFGANVTWKEYADGGHWFKAPEGIDDAVDFVKQHVLGERVGLDEDLEKRS